MAGSPRKCCLISDFYVKL